MTVPNTRSRFSPAKKNRDRRPVRSRDTKRRLLLEQLEDRLLLIGPQLAGIQPNNGDLLPLEATTPVVGAESTRNIAPRSLTFRFDEDQIINPATLGGIQITRSGFDGVFDNGNDIRVQAGFAGVNIAPDQNEVIIRFAETLPDDVYRIEIFGADVAGIPALRNSNGEAYLPRFGSDRDTFFFELELGAQVISVVPQPVIRGPSGLQQARNQIHVFFNNDDLAETPVHTTGSPLDPSVVDPAFYQLILTQDTIRNTDDTVRLPNIVTYDPDADLAILTFGVTFTADATTDRLSSAGHGFVNGDVVQVASSGALPGGLFPATNYFVVGATLDDFQLSTTRGGTQINITSDSAGDTHTIGAPLGAGTFRLRIGTKELTPADPFPPVPVLISPGEVVALGGSGSSFVTAADLGALNDGVTKLGSFGESIASLIISSEIEPQEFLLRFPGSNDEPGHREVPEEIGLGFENHINPAFSTSTDDPADLGLTTISYNFRLNYGAPNNDTNSITERQKTLVRQALDIWQSILGVQFVETRNAGFTFVTGDQRALDVNDPRVFNIATFGIPSGATNFALQIDDDISDGFDGLLILDGTRAWDDDFGGDYFRTVLAGVGLMLGLERAGDLPSATIMALSTQFFTAGTFPEPIFPSDHDIVHGQLLHRPDSNDIDLYKFTIPESLIPAGKTVLVTAETFAERQANASLLDTVLNLYREVDIRDENGVVIGKDWELIARNNDYFSNDSLIEMNLAAGTYFIGVSSTGNENYDPTIENTGFGGTTQGRYDLRLTLRPQVDDEDIIRDIDRADQRLPGTELDGDADGVPGGVFNFWFQSRDLNRALEVTGSAAAIVEGSTVTIQDFAGVSRTFEFDRNNSVTGSNRRVDISTAVTAADVADRFTTAINAAGFGVTAMTSGNRVLLTGDRLTTLSPNFIGIAIQGKTIFVDKNGPAAADGSLARPFNNIANPAANNAFANAQPGDIVRIVGNGGADNNLATINDNFAYEIGFGVTGGPPILEDGSTMEIPRGVTVMIDAGAVFKLRNSRIGVGSSSLTVDRSGGALQVLGTPHLVTASGQRIADPNPGDGVNPGNVLFTSWLDEAIGRDSFSGSTTPGPGNWGGLVFRKDLDQAEGRRELETEGIFLNYVNHADIRFGGGANVLVDGRQQIVNPIQIIDTRPTITYNQIISSADSAMSAAPNSFEDTSFHEPRYQLAGPFTSDYDRVGPDIHGNRLFNNSTNGIFIKINTPAGSILPSLNLPARFDDTDIVHVLAQSLQVAGTPGGPLFDVTTPTISLVVPTVVPGAGMFEAGIYNYKITLVDANGFESPPSAATSNTELLADGDAVLLSDLPAATGDFVARRIYRSQVRDGMNNPVNGPYRLVAELNRSVSTFLDVGNTLGDSANGGGILRVPSAAAVMLTPMLLTPAPGDNLPAGTYNYRISFVDSTGQEHLPSDPTASLTIDSVTADAIELSNLPVVSGLMRRIYRSSTTAGAPYTLIAELNDTDTTYLDDGTTIGGTLDQPAGLRRPRLDARLAVDPGMVVKLEGARFGITNGAQFIAEGLQGQEVIFTSRLDDRFGAGGTFDTNNDGSPSLGVNSSPNAADWSGIYVGHQSSVNIDHALIAFGGGNATIEGTVTSFNVLEIHQAAARVTHSVFENNADGTGGQGPFDRFGRGYNRPATIFVRDAQPIIVDNIFRNGAGATITIDVNSLNYYDVPDVGRTTGAIDRIEQFDDNQGPLVRLNRIANDPDDPRLFGAVNGMVVRGGTLTTEGVWDDTDIVHVVTNQYNVQTTPPTSVFAGTFERIIIPNFHTFGGLRLESSPTESLVVKFFGPGVFNDSYNFNPLSGAGIEAVGSTLDIDDRIGGMLHIVGRPGFPVVMTSLRDDTVGAGFQPDGTPQTDTNNDNETRLIDGQLRKIARNVPLPNDWRSINLEQFSHDRNVEIILEQERSDEPAPGSNATVQTSQVVGDLAPSEFQGDENLRLGFNVRGFLNDPADVDVYSFTAMAGTEVWLDLDRTTFALDAVLELVDSNGNVLARSDNSPAESAETESVVSSGAQAFTMQKTPPFQGQDFWTVNPRDAGMRVVLPGAGTARSVYHVRLRSRDGLTSGNYQLQIRTREVDEFPGSTVRYADIRYATNGVIVNGLPAHSPLLGEVAEDEQLGFSASNNSTTFDPLLPGNRPQFIGNLLDTDRAVLSIAGALSSSQDVDFYRFNLAYPNIVNPGTPPGHQSMVFDVDYADGLTRPDTIVSVFDAGQRLVLIGRDSNIAEDRPRPLEGQDLNDLSRGTVGLRDAYIGPVLMPVNADYLTAVTSNTLVPQQLDQFFNGFLGASPTNPLIRLEPVNSVVRIVEDRIDSDGGSNIPNSPRVTNFIPVAPSAGTNWHQTTRRQFDQGHGVDVAFDFSRPAQDGGASAYFGDDATGTYAAAAGTTQDLASNVFSLKGYSPLDKQVAYFNYFLDLDVAPGDFFRVFVRTATGDVLVASSDPSEVGANVQQLFDQANNPNPSWRQVRIPLDRFAGQENLRLVYRFVADPNPGMGEGAYFDDVIIGFAERGEMVTGADTFATTFTNNQDGPGSGLQSGAYQLELRRAGQFGTSFNVGATTIIATEATLIQPTETVFQIPDGLQFQINNGAGNTFNFEFNSGPEVVYITHDASTGNFVRDGLTFSIDNGVAPPVTFEFDTGPVIEVFGDGSVVNDGGTVTIVNTSGTSVTFEFDKDIPADFDPMNVPVPIGAADSVDVIATQLATTINNFGFNVSATVVQTPAGIPRITLTGDSTTMGVMESAAGISVSGAHGTGPMATPIPVEEDFNPTDFIAALILAVNTNGVAEASLDGNRLNFRGGLTADFSQLISRGIFGLNNDAGSPTGNGSVTPGVIPVPFNAADTAAEIAGRIADAINAAAIGGVRAFRNGIAVQLFADPGPSPPQPFFVSPPTGPDPSPLVIGGLVLIQSFDTNDRLAQQVTLVAPPGSAALEGNTFVISDGINQRRFEFDNSGSVTPGNIRVPFSNTDTDSQVARSIRDAINSVGGQGILDIQAALSDSESVTPTPGFVSTDNRVNLFGSAVVTASGMPNVGVTIHNAFGDSNVFRDQGQVLIHSNFISDSHDFGIVADAGERDQEGFGPALMQSHQGPVRNLRELNDLNNAGLAGGFAPGATIVNNVISGEGLGGIHFSGNLRPFELVPIRPAAYPLQNVVLLTSADSVCDNDSFSITAGRHTVTFEFEDIAGSPANDPNYPCPVGSGVGGGNGWTPGRVPIFYRRSLPGGPPGFSQAAMANAIRTAIINSILITNNTTLVAEAITSGSRIIGGDMAPSFGADPAVFVEHATDVRLRPSAGPSSSIFQITPRPSAIGQAAQPFGHIVNNTIFANDGVFSFATAQPTEPDDTIFAATDTKQGRAQNPETYTASARIGDSPNLTFDPSLDVDFYEFHLDVGDNVLIDIDAAVNMTGLDAVLRVFNSRGEEVAFNDNAAPGAPGAGTLDPFISFRATERGTYYVAVSGQGNEQYSPVSLGNRTGPASTGAYNITINVRAPRTWVIDTAPLVGAGTSTFEIEALNGTIITASVTSASNAPAQNTPVLAQSLANQIGSRSLSNTVALNVSAQALGGVLGFTSSHERYVFIEGAVKVTVVAGPTASLLPRTTDNEDQILRETGILISEESTPTLLNNVIVNARDGIVSVRNPTIFSNSPLTDVKVASVFQANGSTTGFTSVNLGFTNISISDVALTDQLEFTTFVNDTQDFNIMLGNLEPAFVDPEDGNFFPAQLSRIIDSSVDSLSDRAAFVKVKTPMGLSPAPILAPDRDARGQLRSDDPAVATPSGLGSQVFKDRGALDRADFVGPAAVLVNPADNDAPGIDLDPTPTLVQLASGTLSNFSVQLVDGFEAADPFPGIGVDDDSVVGPEIPGLRKPGAAVTVFESGRLLEEGIDYTFDYNTTSDTIILTPLAGIWKNDKAYVVVLNNRDRFVLDIPDGSAFSDGDRLLITDLNGVTVGLEFDTGFSLQVPTNLTIQVPAAGGGQGGVRDADRFTIDDGVNPPVTFELDLNTPPNIVAGNRRVPFTAGSTQDMVADAIVAAIQQAISEGLLTGINSAHVRNVGGGQVHIGASTRQHTLVTVQSALTQPPQTLGLRVPASGVNDGQTFVVNNGATSVRFEFDTNNAVTAGNTPIDISLATTIDDITTQIVSVLNAAASLGLSALNLGNGLINLGASASHSVNTTGSSLIQLGTNRSIQDGDTFTVVETTEVQRIQIAGSPTGGTFTLTFNGQTTAAIPFNANASAVRSALEALPNIDPGDVNVTGGPLPAASIDVQFLGQYAGVNVPQITATASLTGGASPAVNVTPVSTGSGVTFEFENTDIGDGVAPGNTPIPFNFGQTREGIANAIVIAIDDVDGIDRIPDPADPTRFINGAGLGLTPSNFGGGVVHLGGTINNLVLVAGTPGLILTGQPTATEFPPTTLQLPRAVTIQVPLAGGAALADGETFSLNTGTQVITFEFDDGSGVTQGNRAILFTPTDTQDQIAARIASAITNSGSGITASNAGGGQVVLSTLVNILNTSQTALTQSGGLSDAEQFTISFAGSAVTFEFDVVNLNNGFTVGNSPILIRITDTLDEIANAVAAAIGGSAALGLSPQNIGGGQIRLFDLPGHITTLGTGSSLTISGLPGGSEAVLFVQSFTSDQIADAINAALRSRLPNVSLTKRGGTTFFLDNVASVDTDIISNYFLRGIQDLAGNFLKSNQPNDNTQFTILLPRVELDFGDALHPSAPPTYPTLFADDGARHVFAPESVFLGRRVDPDPDARPTVAADGDDTLHPISFGTSVLTGPAVAPFYIQIPSLGGADIADGETFTITNGALATATFEFDSNGSVAAGNVAVPFSSAQNAAAIAGQVVTAIRGANIANPDLALSPVNRGNGIVEIGGTLSHTLNIADSSLELPNVIHVPADGAANIVDGQTFTIGDGVNPDVTFEFESLDLSNGVAAGNVAVPFIPGDSQSRVTDSIVRAIQGAVDSGRLLDLTPRDLGDGTIDVTGDDEDGVSFETIVTPGGLLRLTVSVVGSGLLDAWIDFNRDGDFNDPGEQILGGQLNPNPDLQQVRLINETRTFNLTAPNTFPAPTNPMGELAAARFRFSTTGGLLPSGLATDGEVEDHTVLVVPNVAPRPIGGGIPDQVVDEDDPPVVLNLPNFIFDDDLINGDMLRYSIVSNSNPSLVVATLSDSSDADNLTNDILTLTFQTDQNGTATIVVRAEDRGGLTFTDTFTVTVTPVDDLPQLDLDANNSSGATGNNFATTLVNRGVAVPAADSDATLTDPDSPNLVSLIVTLTNPQDGADEVLAANTAGTNITATFINGVLSLTGSDTVANYQQVLRTVTYNNIATNPTQTPNRIITFVANDGTGNSLTASTTVTVIAENPVPFQNATSPQLRLDVDDDGDIDATDALTVIARLRRFNTQNMLPRGADVAVCEAQGRFSPFACTADSIPGNGNGIGATGFGYVDVSGDNAMSPLDAIQIISFLRAQMGGGEGESAGSVVHVDANGGADPAFAAGSNRAEGEGASMVSSAQMSRSQTAESLDSELSRSQTGHSLGFAGLGVASLPNSGESGYSKTGSDFASLANSGESDYAKMQTYQGPSTPNNFDHDAANSSHLDSGFEDILSDIAGDVAGQWDMLTEELDSSFDSLLDDLLVPVSRS